ncbi:MAG: hypothetical protein JKY42_04395 [Flavobacteriales bacterium]|nr:hypothetical protein [Flavobacteriales bacterium]
MKFSKITIYLLFFLFAGIIFLAWFIHYAASDNIAPSTLKERNGIYLSLRYRLLTDYFREYYPEYHLSNVPHFQFNFSPEDNLFIQQIHSSIETDETTTTFKKYKKLNKWRIGELIYSGKKYDIKWKSHGRSPDNHYSNGNISLNIKVLNGDQIFGTDHFRLIVYNRLNTNGGEFKVNFNHYLADEFGVYMRKHILVNVQREGKHDALYYFEYRLNDQYCQDHIKGTFVILGNKNHKSFLYSSKKNQSKLQLKIKQVIEEKNLSKQLKNSVISRYQALNNCLEHNRYDLVNEFVDENYITSYLAARTLLGANAHGLAEANLYVLFDTINYKFYPMFSRDEMINFQQSDRVEYNMHHYFYRSTPNRTGYFPCFNATLLKNNTLRQGYYQKLYNFIKTKGNTFYYDLQKIINEEEIRHFPEWINSADGLTYLNASPYFNVNGDSLLKYISNSAPNYSILVGKESVSINFEPNSMAALSISKLNLSSNSPNRWYKIFLYTMDGKSVVLDTIQADSMGVVHLETALKETLFYDELDEVAISVYPCHGFRCMGAT